MVTFELRGVAKQYGSLQALQPLDLTVEAGERLAVIGPSGAGKSTLLRLLNTSLRPSSGEVVVFGEETSKAAAGNSLENRDDLSTIPVGPAGERVSKRDCRPPRQDIPLEGDLVIVVTQ